MSGKMVQYSVWANCCNSCQFCLRLERDAYSYEKQLQSIRFIRNNINYIDWKSEFSYGISLLGGELYYITDKRLQDEFLLLIDDIIEKVLKVSSNPECKFSSVTNGIYEPTFLFKVIDKINKAVGMSKVDFNFSYDLKYRYKSEEDRLQVLKNIKLFHERYDYLVGVQMILTQHIINLAKSGQFNVNKLIENELSGNMLTFLYPHPIHTGKKLDDFFFTRKDFLWFLSQLKNDNYQVYLNTLFSIKNSAVFKYTGYKHKELSTKYEQQPVLSDGKEIANPSCGHSILYQCYSDCDKCILCDVSTLEDLS